MACILLAGCFPAVASIYYPVNAKVQNVSGRNCTSNSLTTLLQEDGVSIQLLLPADREALVGTVQIDVASGKTLVLDHPGLTLTSANLSEPLFVELRGTGRLPADVEFVGPAHKSYSFAPALQTLPPEVAISLPDISINGDARHSAPVQFARKRSPQIVFMCQ